MKCPKCQHENPSDAGFCNGCGQKYLPKGITEKILSQRDRIEGERKQVTVMFCDMEGFTSLSKNRWL
jgi:methionyl-tRNA synthetase